MKKKYIFFILFCFMLIFITQEGFSAWEGPTEVIVSGWGSGDNQFGISYGDTHDIFPGFFDISTEGYIVVSDGVNGRFKLFNTSGQLLRNIVPPVANPKEWIIEPKFVGTNIILILNKYFFFSIAGEIIATIDSPGRVNFWTTYNDRLYIEQKSPQQWLTYSPTGALIRTTTERPLELGKVKEKKTATGYTYTVQYPDIVNPNITKTYTVSVEGIIREFKRDANGNLYGIATAAGEDDNDIVYKYDINGQQTGKMQIPPSEYGEIIRDPFGATSRSPLIVQYGSAVISPNGDVYTWKRTQTTYSIIKLTWKP